MKRTSIQACGAVRSLGVGMIADWYGCGCLSALSP
jgi:hypothetical protein